MKICWNNLEKIKYIKKKKLWKYKNRIFYDYKDFCETCGNPFLFPKNRDSLYCSNKCVPHPCFKQTRIKISKSKKGQKSWNKGRKLSKEHKKKLSKARLGKIPWNKGITGKNNQFWTGGYYAKNIPLYNTYAQQISYCEKTRKNESDENILEVACAYCGKWYIPKRSSVSNRILSLNGIFPGEHRLYCSDNCKYECPIYRKVKFSAEESNRKKYSREVQPELRQLVFERDNYTCQKCEKHQDDLGCGLHCHHFEGIEINPIESADVDQCITLCKYCHRETHKNPCPIKEYKRKKCEEIK